MYPHGTLLREVRGLLLLPIMQRTGRKSIWIFISVPEDHKLACCIIQDDHHDICNHFHSHVVAMQQINKDEHRCKIYQLSPDPAGEERDNLFYNSLLCICFGMEHPLSVCYIRKQYGQHPRKDRRCHHRQMQRMREQPL